MMNNELPLIIESRCNERAYRQDNPAFPYSPKEIIREAVRAWEAGASIFHWHGRDPETGKACYDIELYLETIQGIRAETDIILHPNCQYDMNLLVDMVPVVFGSTNEDFWDPQTKQFITYDQLYVNTRAKIMADVEILTKNNIHVSAACWNVGHIRTARCFQEMGLLSENTFWEFIFTGELVPEGAKPTITGLQALVTEIPRDNQWLVLCWNGDVMRLASWAITMGGHVGIGLGDWPYTRFGKPHNGELVEIVAKMAHTLGREVATPAQARKMLKITE
ncbi:MAG: 3-keto-5-aminohexanoate cleavage protein [Cyanobacteria bacterium P01_H01_bin.35]